MPRLVVFTDLDGTLLDHDTYDVGPARPALSALERHAIPLVPVTSKTRSEVVALREALGLGGPFVVENGGAIYIPVGTFPDVGAPRDESGLVEIVLGTPVERVRAVLGEVRRRERLDFLGFGDVSDQQVAAWTGLSLDAAARARARTTSEPVRLEGGPEALGRLRAAVEEAGLSLALGGRFISVQGKTSKGAAVCRLIELFRDSGEGALTTVAAGDSENDIPMLEAVDVAIVVSPKPPRAPVTFAHPRRIQVDLIGPAGFCAGIETVLSEHGLSSSPP